MNPSDSKHFKILLILLAVLVATLWVGREIYQLGSEPPADIVDTAEGSESLRAESLTIEAVDADRLTDQSVADTEPGRNPFQYGLEPPPAVPVSEAPLPLTPEPGDSTPSAAVAEAPDSAPSPAIPFRYNGYAVVDLSGEISALLSDSDRSFVVMAQDVVMGRYRIHSVTEASVEVEDLEFGSRQSLPLITE